MWRASLEMHAILLGIQIEGNAEILDDQSRKDKSVLLVKTSGSEGDKFPSGCEGCDIVKVGKQWKKSAGAAVGSSESILWNQCAKQRTVRQEARVTLPSCFVQTDCAHSSKRATEHGPASEMNKLSLLHAELERS